MSEHRTPVDKVLDLLVYGPAGLAVTAAEEFPRLVEKGRHRLDGQLHTARLVGQFAVQMGRRQVESTLGGWLGGSAPEPAPAGGAVAQDPAPPVGPFPEPAPPPQASENGALASEALGIPGYDSLSASQVVQRLGGLSTGELEAIREHEQAHRHRRTILNRVAQLLSSDAGLG